MTRSLLPVGTLVEALYQHVKPRKYSAWYRATIKRVDERRRTYVIDWEDGDENLRKQPAESVRPLSWGALPQANAEKPTAKWTAAKQQGQKSMGIDGNQRADTPKGDSVVPVGVEHKRAAMRCAEAAHGDQVVAGDQVVKEAEHDAEDMDTESDSVDENTSVKENAAGIHASDADGSDKEREAKAPTRRERKQKAIDRKKAHAERQEAAEPVQNEDTDEQDDEGEELEEDEEDVERSRRVAWSQDEENQLRKMLLAGRNDWEAMGACIGQGRTKGATKQHANHLQKHDDLKIDKRPAKFTKWKVMSQPIAQQNSLSWKTHHCIDAAILERWAGAACFRSCPTQTELEDDPLLCVDIKRVQILKRCMNGTMY
eukprot:COSAG02_NODE_1016_length_15190_cov_128.667418_12_plen_371_part_00